MDITVHQKVLGSTKHTADVECLACGTIHPGLGLDPSGPALEQTPCHHDDCHVRLCASCPQFECTSCGLLHCAAHRVRIGAEQFCGVCVRGYVEDAIEEYRELVEQPALRVQYAPPPIPTTNFDWVAWMDGREEMGSGFGPTRQAAIEDLIEVLA